MADFRTDAERLLAVKPEEFVEERARIARRLRDEGRAEDTRGRRHEEAPARGAGGQSGSPGSSTGGKGRCERS